MINFRYHIVSLMAVFLALAVGIAVGVTLSPSVDQGIITQAQQDRQQVTQLRAEIDRRTNLDNYRNTYDQRTATLVLAGELNDTRVAVVAMPDAPSSTVTAVADAVAQAGGRVVSQVKVRSEVFDPTQASTVEEAVAPLAEVGLTDSMSPAAKVGWCLARAVASKQTTARDDYAKNVGRTLSDAGLADVRDDTDDYAQLVLVVTAPTSPQPVDTALTTAHVELETALKEQAGAAERVGVVVAGPNSAGLTGTDVGAVRTTSPASSELSTVDVADLPSGVVTTVLAGKEQLMGQQGHYGALARADDALPTVR
ncbi:copper transporter [Microlunatus flavus]|uniref:Copper transport outer membrane protein, MctB n=1 Tax=Microlunatus flavus TaxID=1036181 RepID=A0A1H9MQE7_9ACTN|nr:copper transporter [Microlunatus flavus]SER25801.1 Copper transport outer membrane protein, MctB [Microlunatus flavus]